MRRIIFLVLVVISCLSYAAVGGDKPMRPYNSTCLAGDTYLEIGQSLWIADPQLEKMGAGKDWRGFRVVCRATIELSYNNGKPGSVIQRNGATLVLTEVSEDYYQQVISEKFIK
jgi:hypothetical protein